MVSAHIITRVTCVQCPWEVVRLLRYETVPVGNLKKSTVKKRVEVRNNLTYLYIESISNKYNF